MLLSIHEAVRLTIVGNCQLFDVLTIGVHYEEHLMTLILFNAVVAHLINNFLTVRACSCCPNASHGPKSLGGHSVMGELDIVLAYLHLLCLQDTAAHEQGGNDSYYSFFIFLFCLPPAGDMSTILSELPALAFEFGAFTLKFLLLLLHALQTGCHTGHLFGVLLVLCAVGLKDGKELFVIGCLA